MERRGARWEIARADRPWREARIRGLVEGGQKREVAPGQFIEEPDDEYLRYRSAAEKNPERVLDAVRLDDILSRLEDAPARMAVRLHLMGEQLSDIGSALRGNRPGWLLVETGIALMCRLERERYEQRREG